jgi:hypothetical protein
MNRINVYELKKNSNGMAEKGVLRATAFDKEQIGKAIQIAGLTEYIIEAELDPLPDGTPQVMTQIKYDVAY